MYATSLPSQWAAREQNPAGVEANEHGIQTVLKGTYFERMWALCLRNSGVHR